MEHQKTATGYLRTDTEHPKRLMRSPNPATPPRRRHSTELPETRARSSLTSSASSETSLKTSSPNMRTTPLPTTACPLQRKDMVFLRPQLMKLRHKKAITKPLRLILMKLRRRILMKLLKLIHTKPLRRILTKLLKLPATRSRGTIYENLRSCQNCN